MHQAPRAFDVVVYGATGFTGKLVAEYLARRGPAQLTWALAGRNAAKLAAVRDALPSDAGVPAPSLIEADATDPASLSRMAAQTRVVLTTVGPYLAYGEPLVAACVEQATDYVDLTGEPSFVDRILERYDDSARHKGVRIVPCCGFDSVPHDLGALYTVQRLKPTGAAVVEGFVSARGTFSGGTLHSALGVFAEGTSVLSKVRQLQREGLRDGERSLRLSPQRVHYEPRIQGWAAPLMTIDPEVVLRSAQRLSEYGPDFRYAHYARAKSIVTIAAMGLGFGAVAALAQLSATRALLGKIKAPGEGPSEAERAKGWFKVRFVGVSAERVVQTQVTGGDPGYTDTAKMISEAALCLAFERDRLSPHTGVVTPAAGIGAPLFPRLERAGIHFSDVS